MMSISRLKPSSVSMMQRRAEGPLPYKNVKLTPVTQVGYLYVQGFAISLLH